MRKHNSLFSLSIAIIVSSLLLSGCTGLKSEAVEKQYFTLSAVRLEKASPPENGAALRMHKLRVSPQYRGKALVYRTGEFSFKSDFYNEFFVPPESQITRNVREWLKRSGVFRHVVDPKSRVESEYTLEGLVLPLYGDYRDTRNPKAVMGIEFFLMKEASSLSEITFQKKYYKEIPIKKISPEELVRGWNRVLEQILKELEGDLKQVKLDI
jgi:cholesterol transport system auxiliary component